MIEYGLSLIHIFFIRQHDAQLPRKLWIFLVQYTLAFGHDALAADAGSHASEDEQIPDVIEHLIEAERMCQIHADGIEDRQRIGIAPFRQLLHFLEPVSYTHLPSTMFTQQTRQSYHKMRYRSMRIVPKY